MNSWSEIVDAPDVGASRGRCRGWLFRRSGCLPSGLADDGQCGGPFLFCGAVEEFDQGLPGFELGTTFGLCDAVHFAGSFLFSTTKRRIGGSTRTRQGTRGGHRHGALPTIDRLLTGGIKKPLVTLPGRGYFTTVSTTCQGSVLAGYWGLGIDGSGE